MIEPVDRLEQAIKETRIYASQKPIGQLEMGIIL